VKIYKKLIPLFLILSSPNALALSTTDTLGDWRKAEESEKIELSVHMAKILNKRQITAFKLYECVTDTAGNGGLDQMKISEIAAACGILLMDE